MLSRREADQPPVELQSVLLKNLSVISGVNVDFQKWKETLEHAIERIKCDSLNVYFGFAPISSANVEPIMRILTTTVDYYALNYWQKRLLLCLWNYFRRRIWFGNGDFHVEGMEYSDLVGLCSLEMLFSYVIPGAIDSARPRLGLRWLHGSLDTLELQRLSESINLLLDAVYDRSPMESLSQLYPGFHSIRLQQLEGWTLLHLISSSRYLSSERTIKDILRAGMDSVAKDSRGKTALHIAAEHFNWTAVNTLTVLVPTLRNIADRQGNIPLVSMLRVMGISPWKKIVAPERIASLIAMLLPTGFYRDLWLLSPLDRSLTNFFYYADEALVAQALDITKRDASVKMFQSLMFHTAQAIISRHSKSAVMLFNTIHELLPTMVATLMRDHGETVHFEDVYMGFLDVFLGLSFKYHNMDTAVDIIPVLDKFYHSQPIRCQAYEWLFPFYTLVSNDVELLRCALEKMSPEVLGFFLLQPQANPAGRAPQRVSRIPLIQEIVDTLLLKEAVGKANHFFASITEASQPATIASTKKPSIAEIACATHANVTLHAICKTAQRFLREHDDVWPMLQQRCIYQALQHANWKAIDLIRILHDALFNHSKGGNSTTQSASSSSSSSLAGTVSDKHSLRMTVDQTTVAFTCHALASFFNAPTTTKTKSSAAMPRFNEEVAQTFGRLIASFPSQFSFSAHRTHPQRPIVSLLQQEMDKITKQIDGLLLNIRALGPGGAITVPLLWRNHLWDDTYRSYRETSFTHESVWQRSLATLNSSFHGATLRRIARHFVPDLKWQKLAYLLLMYIECLENPSKLLQSTGDYDSLTEKQWSRVETLFSSATRSSKEIQRWCDRLIYGLKLLPLVAMSSISPEQLEALELFVSKFQGVNNMRVTTLGNRGSGGGGGGGGGGGAQSIIPSEDDFQTFKRDDRSIRAVYELYDTLMTHFATVVAPTVLHLAKSTPTSRHNHTQHLSHVEFLRLFYLDRQFTALHDVYQQLVVQEVPGSTSSSPAAAVVDSSSASSSSTKVEGDFLALVFNVSPEDDKELSSSMMTHDLQMITSDSPVFQWVRDLRYFAGEVPAWSDMDTHLRSAYEHHRDTSPTNRSQVLLDECLIQLIDRCSCSTEQLLSYVHVLCRHACFQSASHILRRYHQTRLQYAFQDWNRFHALYTPTHDLTVRHDGRWVAPILGEHNEERTVQWLLDEALFPTLASTMHGTLTASSVSHRKPAAAAASSSRTSASLLPMVLSPVHFALLHQRVDFISLFLSVFPRYPVNVPSLAWITDWWGLYKEWKLWLPCLAHVVQVIVVETDQQRWEALRNERHHSMLQGRRGGCRGYDLPQQNNHGDRAFFQWSWSLLDSLLQIIQQRRRVIAPAPAPAPAAASVSASAATAEKHAKEVEEGTWLPMHWFPYCEGSSYGFTTATSTTLTYRPECDYVTKTAKLYAPIMQVSSTTATTTTTTAVSPSGNPSKPRSPHHTAAVQGSSSSSSSTIRLLAMMDGTWMSFEDVTTHYHNYQRALPAPVILQGYGSLAHALCTHVAYTLDENDTSYDTLTALLQHLPSWPLLFFVRMSKAHPAPLYFLLAQHKYTLALTIMQALVSPTTSPSSPAAWAGHGTGTATAMTVTQDGLLRGHVLAALRSSLILLRGVFPATTAGSGAPITRSKTTTTTAATATKAHPQSVTEKNGTTLLWEQYLSIHKEPLGLPFCASCLEYSQDLWRELTLSQATIIGRTTTMGHAYSNQASTTTATSPLQRRAVIFAQHAGRSDLLKYDTVVRARQVLSILQIPYSQLVVAATAAGETLSQGRPQPRSSTVVTAATALTPQNPDLQYLSPSYLCRRVTSSMYHQLKLLLTGWLHPKLRPSNSGSHSSTGMPSKPNSGRNNSSGRKKEVFASLQVIDDVLLFHHPSFSCTQYLTEELRTFQSATILDKENVISTFLASTITTGTTGTGPSSSSLLHLVRPEDWAALDTIAFALWVLEYARSLCIARVACVITYPEDMTSWIPSSYAKHPLTVIRRHIATLSEDIQTLEGEEALQQRQEAAASDDDHPDEEGERSRSHHQAQSPRTVLRRMFMAGVGVLSNQRGLRSRIGLLDRVTSDDLVTFLQCSAVYSPRLKRLRDILVASLSAMLSDLGKHSAGKMITRLEKKIHIPGYHHRDNNGGGGGHGGIRSSTSSVVGTSGAGGAGGATRAVGTNGMPAIAVFTSAFESDIRVLSDEIIPLLRSLRVVDFWQSGKFPTFRHTFESIVIDSTQDLLVDMVHQLKQGELLTVLEDEETAIYMAFQRQAPMDVGTMTTATGTAAADGATISGPGPRQGFHIPFEILQSQRLYSKSAMDTVYRLRQALQVASVLYWFVGSCYGLINESCASSIYDDDVAVVLDLFSSVDVAAAGNGNARPTAATATSPTTAATTVAGVDAAGGELINLQFHPLLPLIANNPSMMTSMASASNGTKDTAAILVPVPPSLTSPVIHEADATTAMASPPPSVSMASPPSSNMRSPLPRGSTKATRSTRAATDKIRQQQQRYELIRRMVDVSFVPSTLPPRDTSAATGPGSSFDHARLHGYASPSRGRRRTGRSLFRLDIGHLLSSAASTRTPTTSPSATSPSPSSSSSASASFGLVEYAAFSGDVETLYHLLQHLTTWVQQQGGTIPSTREYWSTLLWRILLAARCQCARYESCFRLVWSFLMDMHGGSSRGRHGHVEGTSAAAAVPFLPLMTPMIYLDEGIGRIEATEMEAGSRVVSYSLLSSIDLAAVKAMPALVVELFDHVVAQAATAAISTQRHAHATTGVPAITAIDTSMAMLQLKCSSSVVSLVAMALQALRRVVTSTQRRVYTPQLSACRLESSSMEHKAFQSLLSALYAQCKHRQFSLAHIFHLPTAAATEASSSSSSSSAHHPLRSLTLLEEEMHRLGSCLQQWSLSHFYASTVPSSESWQGSSWDERLHSRLLDGFTMTHWEQPHRSSSQEQRHGGWPVDDAHSGLGNVSVVRDVHQWMVAWYQRQRQMATGGSSSGGRDHLSAALPPSSSSWSLLDLAIVVDDAVLFKKQLDVDFPVGTAVAVPAADTTHTTLRDSSYYATTTTTAESITAAAAPRRSDIWQHFLDTVTALVMFERPALLHLLISHVQHMRPEEQATAGAAGCWWLSLLRTAGHLTDADGGETEREHHQEAVVAVRPWLRRWFRLLFAKNHTAAVAMIEAMATTFLVPMLRPRTLASSHDRDTKDADNNDNDVEDEDEDDGADAFYSTAPHALLTILREDILPFVVGTATTVDQVSHNEDADGNDDDGGRRSRCNYRDVFVVPLLEAVWTATSPPPPAAPSSATATKTRHTTSAVRPSSSSSSSSLSSALRRQQWLREFFEEYRCFPHHEEASSSSSSSSSSWSLLIHLFIRRRQVALVRFWLHRVSANTLVEDSEGYTALDTAIGTGDAAITRQMKPLLPIFLRKTLVRMTRALHALRLRRVIARSEAFLAQFDKPSATSTSHLTLDEKTQPRRPLTAAIDGDDEDKEEDEDDDGDDDERVRSSRFDASTLSSLSTR